MNLAFFSPLVPVAAEVATAADPLTGLLTSSPTAAALLVGAYWISRRLERIEATLARIDGEGCKKGCKDD